MRNALRRSLLWNTWLQIETFTNQTSTFLKNTYVNKETLLIFDWNNIPQIVFDFIID